MRSRRLLETRREIVEALRRVKKELCAEVYLFGSYAKGTHTIDSDVDIIVVSEEFRGLNLVDRIVMVRRLLPEDKGFDMIALTPEEFEEKKKKAFYREVSRYWVRID